MTTTYGLTPDAAGIPELSATAALAAGLGNSGFATGPTEQAKAVIRKGGRLLRSTQVSVWLSRTFVQAWDGLETDNALAQLWARLHAAVAAGYVKSDEQSRLTWLVEEAWTQRVLHTGAVAVGIDHPLNAEPATTGIAWTDPMAAGTPVVPHVVDHSATFALRLAFCYNRTVSPTATQAFFRMSKALHHVSGAWAVPHQIPEPEDWDALTPAERELEARIIGREWHSPVRSQLVDEQVALWMVHSRSPDPLAMNENNAANKVRTITNVFGRDLIAAAGADSDFRPTG